MLWIKFGSTAFRNRALELLIPEKPSISNHQIWMTEDLPLEFRCEKGFLFGLKRLLLSWGWEAFETRVDLESGKLLIDGSPIIHVKADHGILNVTFTGGLAARLDDQEFHALVNSTEEKLKKKPIGKGWKGVGK